MCNFLMFKNAFTCLYSDTIRFLGMALLHMPQVLHLFGGACVHNGPAIESKDIAQHLPESFSVTRRDGAPLTLSFIVLDGSRRIPYISLLSCRVSPGVTGCHPRFFQQKDHRPWKFQCLLFLKLSPVAT